MTRAPGSTRDNRARESPPGLDSQLISLTLEGQTEAFGTLYDRYFEVVFRFVLHRVAGSVVDAEELAQETFRRAFERLSSFRGEGPFAAWLLAIARREAADWHGGRLAVSLLREDVPDAGPPMEEPILRSYDRDRMIKDLEACVQNLAEQERTLFRLVAAEGLSHRQVAVVLSLSEENCRKKFERIRKRLAQALVERVARRKATPGG